MGNRQASKEDTMAIRIPKAEVPVALRDAMIRQLGSMPEPVEVEYDNPAVAVALQEFGARQSAWDAADRCLKTFAHRAVAAQAGCSWCLDVNYFLAVNHDLDPVKASQVPAWRDPVRVRLGGHVAQRRARGQDRGRRRTFRDKPDGSGRKRAERRARRHRPAASGRPA
jgi:hypothetical protein